MSEKSTARWGYSSSPEPERWDASCASREEAIAEGTDAFSGEPFYIISGSEPHPFDFFGNIDSMLDSASECAHDVVGEAAEDWPPTISDEARKELRNLLEEWAEKHLPVHFWIADGDPERIEPTDSGCEVR